MNITTVNTNIVHQKSKSYTCNIIKVIIDGENCSGLRPEQSMRDVHLLCNLSSPWKKWVVNDTAHRRSVPTGRIQPLDELLQSGTVHDVVHMIENDVVDIRIEGMILGKAVWNAFELYGEL